MPHIVVVGSTMIDMIAYAQRLPGAGETVQGDTFALGFGGKGANQAVMARRCGAKVTMVNTLGDDVFGDTTLKNFQEQGVDTEFINRVPGPSGVAPIWVEPNGTNRIICVPGANNAMTTEQVESALSAMPEIDLVIGQLEIPQAVTAAAFRSAQARAIPTILNPAPFAPISDELLAAVDWLIPNESEFAALHPEGKQPESDQIIEEFAKMLKLRVVVTLGEAGAAYSDRGNPVVRISAPKVSAIDTTGAGDSFVGAFSFALSSGLSESESIRLGCLCASESVTRLGTQSSYPTADQAAELIRSVRGS
jgi:ribokinase